MKSSPVPIILGVAVVAVVGLFAWSAFAAPAPVQAPPPTGDLGLGKLFGALGGIGGSIGHAAQQEIAAIEGKVNGAGRGISNAVKSAGDAVSSTAKKAVNTDGGGLSIGGHKLW